MVDMTSQTDGRTDVVSTLETSFVLLKNV